MPFNLDVPKRKPIVELPLPMVSSVLELSQFKLEHVSNLLKLFKMNDGQVKVVDTVINQVQDMGLFG